MRVFIRIVVALALLAGNVLLFQTSSWGIDFIAQHYWVRFIHPVIGSFLFAGIATGSFNDYKRGWKIDKELNPTRWLFLAGVVISVIMSLLIE